MALIYIELVHTFVFFKLHFRNGIIDFIKHWIILTRELLFIFLLPFFVDNLVRFC